MTDLTVGNLKDIADSQLIVHGDQLLFIHPEYNSVEGFELYVGEKTILECLPYEELISECAPCDNAHNLTGLIDNISNLDDSEIIHATHLAPFDSGFRIGFKSKTDGFVELINSTEMQQPTKVLEN